MSDSELNLTEVVKQLQDAPRDRYWIVDTPAYVPEQIRHERPSTWPPQ